MAQHVVVSAVMLAWTACGFSASPATEGDGGMSVSPPVVGFRAAASLEDETSGAVMVPVGLSMATTTRITVGYSITAGTAQRDTDFAAVNGVLTFEPGDIEEGVPITILHDSVDEQNETLAITLHSVTGGGELGSRDHTLTISANTLPRVSFATPSSNGGEQSQVGFTAVLDLPSSQEVRVDYTLAGTATEQDYALVAGTITFPPGVASKQIMLSPIDDALDEDPETVRVTLVNSVNAVILSSGATRVHTLDDNDPLPALSISAAATTISEGTATTTLSVKLSPVSGREVSVGFAAAASPEPSASAADFSYQTVGPLVFPAGTTTQTITVNIVEDPLDEDNEAFTTALQNPTNATLGTSTLAVTITDNDNEPTVGFDPGTPSAGPTEGDSGTLTYDYRVILSAKSGKPVSVPFTVTTGGNPTTPGDYTVSATPVTIPAGDLQAAIRITVVGDTAKEPDQTITLQLQSGPTNATLGSDVQRVHTIKDDD